jgi:pyrroline-5-carboxylate reductase
MEAFMKAGQEIGLTSSVAELLVEQTFSGALDLLKLNTFDCKTWIEKVSSKGGTTEAAIKSFNTNDLDRIITQGVKAAFERAEALGK